MNDGMKKLVPGKLYTNLTTVRYWLLVRNTIFYRAAKLSKEKEISHLMFLKVTKDKKYQFLYKNTICELTEGCYDAFLRNWK